MLDLVIPPPDLEALAIDAEEFEELIPQAAQFGRGGQRLTDYQLGQPLGGDVYRFEWESPDWRTVNGVFVRYSELVPASMLHFAHQRCITLMPGDMLTVKLTKGRG